MVALLVISIYFIGAVVTMFVMKVKGRNEIVKNQEEAYDEKDTIITLSLFWPFALAFTILLSPFLLIINLYDKI